MKYILAFVVALVLVSCAGEEQEIQQNGETMTAPSEYRSDADVWGNTGDEVLIKGCEEWKERDEEADC